nr:organic cation transporter protein-like [Cherax quadricarinatus]
MSNNSKFDDLLTQLGTSKWNIIYFLAASFWVFMVPPQFISGVYLAPAVNYTCRPPESEEIVQISKDSCYYSTNGSSSVGLEDEPCTEWDFDTSVFTSTLTSEFSLVCKRDHLRATYQSIYMMGTIFSPLLAGYLADRYTALEVCEPKNRGLVGIMMGLPWALGTMLWGALAYCIREWRWLQAAVSFPILLALIPTYFIDESPRWLIVNGHYDKALKVLEKASRWNKVSLPPEEDLRALMRNIQEESVAAAKARETVQEGSEKLFKKLSRFLSRPGVLSNRVITVVTVIVCLDNFAASLVFDGLNLSGDNYSADPFLYIVLGGLMEVPGYTINGPIIDRWGRRVPTALSFIICGILLLTLTFIPSGLSWLVVTLALAGKVCISGAFQIIYVYSSELFPTEVRLQGLGAASVFGQLGSVILPYITTYLGPLVPWAPSVIFASLSLMAGVITMALHETAGEVLPDTITDLKNIGLRRNREKNVESTEMEQTRYKGGNVQE